MLCKASLNKLKTVLPSIFFHSLEFDRTWCIVDLEGTHVPKFEAISGRRVCVNRLGIRWIRLTLKGTRYHFSFISFSLQIPTLATIKVSFDSDILCLDAPGMSQLKVPTSEDAYADAPTIRVESAGPIAGGTWSLAFLDCKQHAKGSAWINEYLNKPVDAKETDGRLINGKKIPGKFAFVRSFQDVVDLGSYPPILPLIERAKKNSEYKARFEGNYRRLSDFAPFLLVSKSSAKDLASMCEVGEYPIRSFRGNIVIDGDELEPWAEETWATLEISSTTGAHEPLVVHTIKQCPRCTVPCRDQTTTGQFLFKDNKFMLWKVLKRVFPRKFSDPEWGSWAGVFMGVYIGHNGMEGKLAVGDVITPKNIVPWDAHLKKEKQMKVLAVLGVGVAVVSVGAALLLKQVP